MARIYTPAICGVNLGAVKRNFSKLGAVSRLMPVVKSDAYGHGLTRVAKALREAGARCFAVGVAAEGTELRDEGIRDPACLLMGCQTRDDWEMAIRGELTPLLGSFEELRAADTLARELGADEFPVGVKCDTGMSRLGFAPEDAAALPEELSRLKRLKPVLLASHFACADNPEEEDFTRAQSEIFGRFYEALRSRWPDIKRTLANSAGALAFPDARFELSRPGFALYGGDPFGGVREETPDFEWAMSLKTPILAVRDLAAGQSVSYGRLYVATRPVRVAVIACGYANGLPRRLSGRFEVLINGRRARQIGAVCMSMSLVDIGSIPDVKPGDYAWILGGGPDTIDAPITAVELARLYDAIPYEILCLFGSMNPRKYGDE